MPYTQKNPNYADGHPYDRIWDYSYISAFAGLRCAVQLSRHFKLGVFSRIGYPLKKEMEYKEVLRGNYIWKSTGSHTWSVKKDVDALNFSAGLGLLGNL